MESGKIKKIKIFHKKGEPGKIVPQAECVADCGLLGDRFAKGGEKQLTAIDEVCENWLCAEKTEGLCFKRFKANITVENMDLSAFKSGQKLIFEDAELEFSEEKKECFAECVRVQNKMDCMLRNHAKYLRVSKGGIIRENDKIKAEE
ncbi:MAG: hypothetical protein IJO54_00255 [Oscillospiraceae bacterium]|nr:hypothetical protein [Oscillospiraceae bacterium]